MLADVIARERPTLISDKTVNRHVGLDDCPNEVFGMTQVLARQDRIAWSSENRNHIQALTDERFFAENCGDRNEQFASAI